jgi:hypothetical protein
MKRARYYFFFTEEAAWREESNGARFIAKCYLIRELWSFKFFLRQKKRVSMVSFKKFFVANLNQIRDNLMYWTNEFRDRKSTGRRRHLVVWEPKKGNVKINFNVILLGNYRS